MILLFLGAALISFSPILVKFAHTEPTATAFYRMAIGGAVLAALRLGQGRRVLGADCAPGPAVLAGILFALDLICWHRAIHLVGPGLATLLANFQVFILAAAAVLVFHSRPSWKFLVGVPAAFAGVGCITGFDLSAMTEEARLGLGLGLAAAVCYAGFILAIKKALCRGPASDAVAALTTQTLAAAAFLALAVAVEGASLAVPDLQTAGALAAYGLVGQVLGWFLVTRGMASTEPHLSGLILLLQPTLAFVWDVLLFGRPFGPSEALGAVLTVGGIYLGSVEKKP